MGSAELFAALELANDHWRTGKVSAVVRKDDRKRRSFFKWRERVTELPFRIIVGPRQVGKTTTMGHLMQEMLDRGIPPNRVMYTALDQPGVVAELGGGLDPLLDVLERFLLRSPLAGQKEPVFLFLDEIQAVEDWPCHLKALYDKYHPWLRVVATGSSAAALRNAPRHEQVGRWLVDQLFPLKFNEVMEILHPDRFDPGTSKLWKAAHEARKVLQTHSTVRIAPVVRALSEAHATLLPHRKDFLAAFDRYLTHGGYPAAIIQDRPEATYLFLQATVEAAITTDLKLFRGLRKPNQFRAFLATLARNHGGKFNSANHASDLGLQKETPAKWKAVAEELYLVRQLGAVSPKGKPQPRRPDKAYIQDTGIRAYLSSENDLAALDRRGSIGLLVEGVVHDHLLRLQFIALDGPQPRPLGYVDPPEIDFLVALKDCWLAVECKYAARVLPADIAEFRRRASKLDLELPVVAIMLSRDSFEDHGDVIVLPAWLFCYLV